MQPYLIYAGNKDYLYEARTHKSSYAAACYAAMLNT